jgi:hypothetical protein
MRGAASGAPRRLVLLILLGSPCPSAAKDQKHDSLLRNLPREYTMTPWQRFQGEKSLTAFTKEVDQEVSRAARAAEACARPRGYAPCACGLWRPAYGAEPVRRASACDFLCSRPLCASVRRQEGMARPAVVKVLARAKVPVRALLDTFLSQDQRVVNEWNPFTGDVLHIDKATQLQTYRMPWPFASREYLVRCVDASQRGRTRDYLAHCASIDEHPSAPLRTDRVRGSSETVWRFTEHKDGETSIHLETLVDPKGGLPKWVVDKAGKTAAVKIVGALIKYTTDRYKAQLQRGKKGSCSAADAPMAGHGGETACQPAAVSAAYGAAEAASAAAGGALAGIRNRLGGLASSAWGLVLATPAERSAAYDPFTDRPPVAC